MTLKIIGAGYGRTGTMSTFTALNQLGFPCYHMIEVILNKANKGHLDFWRQAAHEPPGKPLAWQDVSPTTPPPSTIPPAVYGMS